MRKPVETAADPFAPEARTAEVEAAPDAIQEEATRRRGWRRLLQVNLLMVLVALALVSGYFAMRRNFLVPYLEQKVAREELAKRGAQFSAVPASPKWVQTLFQISDDDFQNVEMIKLEHSDEVRDAHLVHLHKFPHLERLYLAATRVTDDGLKHLRYCTKLRRISLWDTHVGDAGIRELETLRDLRIIDIHRTWTTDQALETLGRLPALEELILDDATTNRGIAHLSGLKNLRRLSLRTTSLQADCLVSLADCPIEVLELPHDFADRETAENFRHVPRTRSLILSLSAATDEDLEWLAAMRSLRRLDLHELQAEGAFAKHIARMRSLETLAIDSDRLQSEHLASLLSAPRLKEASLKVAVTDDELARLSAGRVALSVVSPWHATQTHYLPQEGRPGFYLQRMRLRTPEDAAFQKGKATTYVNHSHRYMQAEDLGPLLEQKDLVELELHNWQFAPGALAALAQLDRLEAVSLEGCWFEPVELNVIAALPQLRQFYTRRTPVRNAQAAAFLESPRLRALDLDVTDAEPETVLALVKKESLKQLRVVSTTLHDAFLDEVDAHLAPRARAAVEPVALEGAPKESIPHYVFVSTGFSEARASRFRDRYHIATGVAKEPGKEAPDGHWGHWPREGTFGWIDPNYPAGLELSPLEIDFPDVGPVAEGEDGGVSPRWFASYLEFAHALSWKLQERGYFFKSTSRPSAATPWNDWQIVLPEDSAPQNVVHVPLDRFGPEAVQRMLEIESKSIWLGEGAVPEACLDELAKSQALHVALSAGCRYDAETLHAVARMPRLESVNFDLCRKPTREEVSLLYASSTLRAIKFAHRGEPLYFDEIAPPGSRQTLITLTDKVVYEAEDAIQERPQNLILANFADRLWPAILADPQAIVDMRMQDDWANQWRLRVRLELMQRERDEASQPRTEGAL